MDTNDKFRKLLKLFVDLRQILANENESNWIRGIDLIIDKLYQANKSGEKDIEESLEYANTAYKSMATGNGSFSDFFIWRDNFKERKEANEKLDLIRSDIWHLINN